jgi:subtilase family serine protease
MLLVEWLVSTPVGVPKNHRKDTASKSLKKPANGGLFWVLRHETPLSFNFRTSILMLPAYGRQVRPHSTLLLVARCSYLASEPGRLSNWGKQAMKHRGLRIANRAFLVVAAASVFCQPIFAQHALIVLPPSSVGDGNPISFMRPHYIIHQTTANNLAAPPTSAFIPAKVRHAYGFDQILNQGAGQVIGIVDAYDDPNAEADLGVFTKQFSLAACTTANGCFHKIYSNGKKPASNANWAVEIALDIQWAHAIAPQAKIVLVETPSNSLSDLVNGVDVAVRNGASAVSMSWTAAEFSGEKNLDNHFVSNGVTFFAASGDSGTGVAYPAASPYVIGVGGTSLTVDSNGNYLSETAWSGSGGGESSIEAEPLFQEQFKIPNDSRGTRGVPDVSYNANPGTGYAVYDSVSISGASGWFQVGGTSAAAPQWAALVSIANSSRVAARKGDLSSTDSTLYSLAKTALGTDFHAVTQGTNGTCGALCTASTGFDFVTGLGTPQAKVLISSLVAQH